MYFQPLIKINRGNQSMSQIIVKAGRHNRNNSFVTAALSAPMAGDVHVECNGVSYPAQLIDGGKAILFAVTQAADAEATYEVKEGAVAVAAPVCVKAGCAEDNCYDIMAGDKLITTLRTSTKWDKPFMFPLNNSRGTRCTRSYPVVMNVPGEPDDHWHQRSLWTAWGEVNTVNLWEEQGHCGRPTPFGKIIVRDIRILEQGPIRVKIALKLDWDQNNGTHLMSEYRELSFMVNGDKYFIDFDVNFTADCRDILLGDTKEGGLCSVRVASSMDGTGTGLIQLADGSIGEDECWGKRSPWCDYYGNVEDGKTGICIMDNPQNAVFPTYWHVRNYGLMTANPFGVSYFTDNWANNGSFIIRKGASSRWMYRVVVHLNTATEDAIADLYQDYIHAPKASAN